MNKKIELMVPLNRVEGDLEIKVELDNGIVSNAWSAGTLYRGFENIILGRDALDALVITPRICGICTTSHLLAAAKALDQIAGVTPPPNGIRLRNIALLAEEIQNDLRQSFLMYTPDFVNPCYEDHPLYEEVAQRYTPFKGTTVIGAVKETKKLVEIIAVIGGQWPHSSYMVPGGISTLPSAIDLLRCKHLAAGARNWYEKQVLGCSLERWQAVQSVNDLEKWLAESNHHKESDLGLFIRFARSIGLDKTGAGCGNFISYGSLEIPSDSSVSAPTTHQGLFTPAGFARNTSVEPLNPDDIAEHVAYSWFESYEGGKHPYEGKTVPALSEEEDHRYTWAKAPRYQNDPAETGALAEQIINKNPLFTDWVNQFGPSTFIRQLARIVRPVEKLQLIDTWLSEAAQDGEYYQATGEIDDGEGFGMVQAARGALGHWVKVKDGLIEHYQVITPTAWNGSPRDSNHTLGPWESALIGTVIKDNDNPIELGHIIRSFDPCLVCTVHALINNQHSSSLHLG